MIKWQPDLRSKSPVFFQNSVCSLFLKKLCFLLESFEKSTLKKNSPCSLYPLENKNPPPSKKFSPPFSLCFFPMRAESFFLKNLLSCYLPSFPYQDSNTCCSSPSFPFLTYIYHPLRPKFSKKENSPISFLLFFSVFKSSNQKQSSQFQIPLQNLSRRVPSSLNSNGKFPCKNMKFLK